MYNTLPKRFLDSWFDNRKSKTCPESYRRIENPKWVGTVAIVRGPNPDLERAFQAGVKGGVTALITLSGPLLNRYRKQIAELVIKNRLPSMYEGSTWIEAGGLMSY